jgi:hypothetical protein
MTCFVRRKKSKRKIYFKFLVCGFRSCNNCLFATDLPIPRDRRGGAESAQQPSLKGRAINEMLSNCCRGGSYEDLYVINATLPLQK